MSHGMWGLFLHNRQRQKPPPIQGQRQLGYLWGTGDECVLLGDPLRWHWQASKGLAVAKWTLWFGKREIGLEVYPTHEERDWTHLLDKMLDGLEHRLEEPNPLSDDEIADITHSAKEKAEYVKSFQWLPEERKPMNPFEAGTPAGVLWQQVYDDTLRQR